MNCRNCGAPMTLVRDKDYFYCEHCTSYCFPQEDADGVRVLGEATHIPCPVCRKELVTASIGGARALTCANCRGVLLDQPVFGMVVTYLPAPKPGPRPRPRPLNPQELQRRLGCPRCGAQMDTHPYYGPGQIVIDTCERCRVVWLDWGELARVLNAAGHERGKPVV